MDLRWMENEIRRGTSARIPGRPSLRARWGWTDHRVRTLLADEDAWCDPRFKTESPAHRQPTASAPPADRQPVNGSSVVISEKPPADRQPTASASPANLHTRVGEQVNKEQGTRNKKKSSPSDEDLATVEAARAVYERACGRRVVKANPKTGHGLDLVKAIKKHGAASVADAYTLAANGSGRIAWMRSKRVAWPSLIRGECWKQLETAVHEGDTATGRPQQSDVDPWQVFTAACSRARNVWAGVPAQLPEEDRDRMVKASAEVRAFARLLRSTHDLTTKQIAADFRGALEAR